MSPITELFGDKLLRGSDEVTTSAALDGKFVMVYFSAHWCPPCRGFTPNLVKFYNELKGKRDDFELVFASSDKDEAAFKEYYGEMPWLALPYADRKLKDELSKKYKVRGIPSLVVIGKDGETITTGGRGEVDDDPEGGKFPWIPPTFEDVVPAKLDSKDGQIETSSLDDKYLMVYFSAHWCPPCRGFTPDLVKAYNDLKGKRDDFELVFASSDKDEAAFKEYYGEMPWLALPYAERDAKESISKIYGVEGIPSLIVLDKKVDGKRKTINPSARGEITDLEAFPWHPKPYGDLAKTTECSGSDINEDVSLCVFCENEDDDEQAAIVKTVKAAAEENEGKGKKVLFFYAKESGGVVGRIRELTGLSKKQEGVIFVKLDIPDNGGYYVKEGVEDVTKESILAFVNDSGDRKQLG